MPGAFQRTAAASCALGKRPETFRGRQVAKQFVAHGRAQVNSVGRRVRMLIAQVVIHALVLVSIDEVIDRYGVNRIW